MELLGRILMVEDDPKDVELTLTALEEYNLSNEVIVTTTARKPWIISITAESSRGVPMGILPSCCWI
jgi:hypothetical protein